MNGFDGSGFSDGGLRGGRQKGSRALAEDFAFVARADYTDIPGLIVGASVYLGDSGQGGSGLGDTSTSIYELHGEWKARGFWLRGLAAMAEVDDVDELNAANGFSGADSVGEELEGFYVEAGYDVLGLLAPETSMSLSPYLRFESIDTQAAVPSGFASDPANDFDVVTLGINFQPIDNVVFKFDYQDYDDGLDRFNASVGYAF